MPLKEPEFSEDFSKLLEMADRCARLEVWANADTPEDARRAREFGARGIGLCRTEHMFMAADRLPSMQRMVIASKKEDRIAALAELEEMQRGDFLGIFEAMDGLPVTIRMSFSGRQTILVCLHLGQATSTNSLFNYIPFYLVCF